MERRVRLPVYDQEPSRSSTGNLFGIEFARDELPRQSGRAERFRTPSDGPVTAEKNTRSRVSVMVTRWRRWLRCGVPSGKRVHPPHKQLCHRTQDHKNLRFKSSDVPLKHQWRPIGAESHIQGWRLGRPESITGESQNQGCLEFDCPDKKGQELNIQAT